MSLHALRLIVNNLAAVIHRGQRNANDSRDGNRTIDSNSVDWEAAQHLVGQLEALLSSDKAGGGQ